MEDYSNNALSRTERQAPNGNVNYPILNYNVAVNVGDYEHSGDVYVGSDTLTLDFFVLKADQKKLKRHLKL